jgi:cobalt-zinc-cadmium efflux system outer membrane protein
MYALGMCGALRRLRREPGRGAWSEPSRPARTAAAALVVAAALATSVAAAEPEAAPPAADVGRFLRDTTALATWLRQRGPDVAAASARVSQARADVAGAKLLPNPVFDTSVADMVLGASNPPGLRFVDTAMFTFGVSETIELGKRGPRIEGANLRLDGARRDADATVADRVAAARGAIGRVVYVRAKQALIEDALAAAKRASEVERVRLEQGAISGTDFDRIELERMALETDAARSRSEVIAALAACRAAVLSPCEGVGASLGDLDAAAPLPPSTAPDAIEKRPDVVALRLKARASEQDRMLAERRAIPDPTLRLAWVHDRLVIAGDQLNTMTVGLTVPIPMFDHGQADAARASARTQELEHTARAIVAGAASDLTALLARKAYVEEALERLNKTALPKSTGVVAVSERAFTQGQVDLTDLLLARRAHLALLVSGLDLRFEYFAVRSELRHVLGLDGAEPPKESP